MLEKFLFYKVSLNKRSCTYYFIWEESTGLKISVFPKQKNVGTFFFRFAFLQCSSYGLNNITVLQVVRNTAMPNMCTFFFFKNNKALVIGKGFYYFIFSIFLHFTFFYFFKYYIFIPLWDQTVRSFDCCYNAL